jgi:hypothetical protein
MDGAEIRRGQLEESGRTPRRSSFNLIVRRLQQGPKSRNSSRYKQNSLSLLAYVGGPRHVVRAVASVT